MLGGNTQYTTLLLLHNGLLGYQYLNPCFYLQLFHSHAYVNRTFAALLYPATYERAGSASCSFPLFFYVLELYWLEIKLGGRFSL